MTPGASGLHKERNLKTKRESLDGEVMRRHWNYHVLRFTHPMNGAWLQIHEVYYDDQGKPSGYTQDAVCVTGDSIEDLETVLDRMREGIAKLILTRADFGMKDEPPPA